MSVSSDALRRLRQMLENCIEFGDELDYPENYQGMIDIIDDALKGEDEQAPV